jgi:hypothetical protein
MDTEALERALVNRPYMVERNRLATRIYNDVTYCAVGHLLHIQGIDDSCMEGSSASIVIALGPNDNHIATAILAVNPTAEPYVRQPINAFSLCDALYGFPAGTSGRLATSTDNIGNYNARTHQYYLFLREQLKAAYTNA